MIKIKTHFQIWKPGISFEINLAKWKFSYSVYENQHAKWAAFHVGPISLSFLWDNNPFN